MCVFECLFFNTRIRSRIVFYNINLKLNRVIRFWESRCIKNIPFDLHDTLYSNQPWWCVVVEITKFYLHILCMVGGCNEMDKLCRFFFFVRSFYVIFSANFYSSLVYQTVKLSMKSSWMYVIILFSLFQYLLQHKYHPWICILIRLEYIWEKKVLRSVMTNRNDFEPVRKFWHRKADYFNNWN